MSLILAEIYTRQNNLPLAQNYLLYTAKRNKDITSIADLPTTQADLLQFISEERIREFSLEMKIWDDIQRTRKYPVTSASNKGAITFIDVIGAQNPWGATFQEKHMLWPISEQELQRNPSLEQNTGY